MSMTSSSYSRWCLHLLLYLVLGVGVSVDVDVVHAEANVTDAPTTFSPITPTPTPTPTTAPTRPPFLTRLLGSQPLYVGSGSIGTSYPDVGVVMLSWTYAQDLIIHNRTVYTLPAIQAFLNIRESGVLGGRMIRMELLDDGSSSQQAQKNLLTGLITDPENVTALPLLGVLGSQVPGSTQLMQLSSTLDLVGMSSATSFDWIMEKNLYQTVALTNVQYSRQVDSLFALLVSQSWRRIGVLGPQDATFNAFLAYATTRIANIPQNYAQIAAAAIAAAPRQPSKYMFLLDYFLSTLQTLKDKSLAVFAIASFDYNYGNVIYTALKRLGILDNPAYVVICIGSWCTIDSSKLSPPEEFVGTRRSNIISLQSPPPDPQRYNNLLQQILNRTASLGYNDTEQAQVKQALTDPNMVPILPHYYDMAYIMLSSIAKLYESGVPFTSQTLYKIIKNSTFTSPVTGTVRVDANGIVAAPIGFYQMLPRPNNNNNSNSPASTSTLSSGSWTLIGSYVAVNAMTITRPPNASEISKEAARAAQQFSWSRSFVYYTPNGLPPPDQIVKAPPSIWHTSTSLNHGIYGFAGAITGLILLLGIIVWWYRHTLLIKCTQLEWSLLLLFSLAVLSVSTVFYVLSPADHGWLCDVRPCCTAMSLVCVLVTLLTKVNRIRYIYNNRDISSTREKQGRDTWIFSVLLLPQIVLLVAFSAAKLSTRTTFTSNNIGTNNYTMLCTDLETTGWLIWFIFELIYICMLLLALLYIAFSIRHTPSAFNESHHLLSCVFALCVVLAILIPLQFIVNSDPSAVLLVRGIGQPLTAFIITIVLFGPKLRYLYVGRGNDSALAEKYYVKGSPALQQDEGMFSSVMDTHEGGPANGYPKNIQQHEYTALFLRCSHLEQQMARIRALLLKCASDDNMVLNDDTLNLMFLISQLADEVALKHGPFSFSQSVSGSSFESSQPVGEVGLRAEHPIGYPIIPNGHVINSAGDPNIEATQTHPDPDPESGQESPSYETGPTHALAHADHPSTGNGPLPSPSPAPAPAPHHRDTMYLHLDDAMAGAVKAGQLDPMQQIQLPLSGRRASNNNNNNNQPAQQAATAAQTATSPNANPKPNPNLNSNPCSNVAPAHPGHDNNKNISVLSKTNTSIGSSSSTDTSYLASSASSSNSVTPNAETRIIPDKLGSGSVVVSNAPSPTTREKENKAAIFPVSAPASFEAGAHAPSSRYSSYIETNHSHIPVSHVGYGSHTHVSGQPSSMAASQPTSHNLPSQLFAARVQARKHGLNSSSASASASTTPYSNVHPTPMFQDGIDHINQTQPGAPNGSRSREDSHSQVHVSFWE